MMTSTCGSKSILVRQLLVLAICFFLCLVTTVAVAVAEASAAKEEATPTPRPWPHQFHSILMMNYSGELEIIDLWYDWTNGRNFNIIQQQLSDDLFYDLEWNNGTSFWYNFNSSSYCQTSQLDVGILRPNWLDGANYLGQHHVDGFLCNAWEKVDFIWYYENVLTHRPVHWRFYTGRAAHVMTFKVGAVLEDAKWQAPAYCFQKKDYENGLEADNTWPGSRQYHKNEC